MKIAGFYSYIFVVVCLETLLSHCAVHDCCPWVWHWLPQENGHNDSDNTRIPMWASNKAQKGAILFENKYP